MITTINEFKNHLNESNDWKEELDNLLSDGDNPDATALWDTLSDEAKEEYKEHYYMQAIDFAQSGSWENGVKPTRQEVIEDLMYLLHGGLTNESVENQVVRDLTKSYAKVQKALSALKEATREFKGVTEDATRSNNPYVEKYAKEIYSGIKGNFGYVLNGDLSKYWQWIANSFEKTVTGSKTKIPKVKVVVPPNASFNQDELTKMITAIMVDKVGINSMSYRRGDGYVLFNGTSGDSTSQVSRQRGVFRDVLDFLYTADPKVKTKWVEKMKALTGLTFENQGKDYLYVNW